MNAYIQYKAFTNIDEFNEWLKDFKFRPNDDENKSRGSYVKYEAGRALFYRGMQFLGTADVNGEDDKVAGQARFYPVASYEVIEA